MERKKLVDQYDQRMGEVLSLKSSVEAKLLEAEMNLGASLKEVETQRAEIHALEEAALKADEEFGKAQETINDMMAGLKEASRRVKEHKGRADELSQELVSAGEKIAELTKEMEAAKELAVAEFKTSTAIEEIVADAEMVIYENAFQLCSKYLAPFLQPGFNIKRLQLTGVMSEDEARELLFPVEPVPVSACETEVLDGQPPDQNAPIEAVIDQPAAPDQVSSDLPAPQAAE